MDATISASDDSLRHWIHEHHVCWEIAPLVELLHRKEIRVGFELQLLARSDSAGSGPGAPEDRAIYHGLEDVAEQVGAIHLKAGVIDILGRMPRARIEGPQLG